MDQARTISILSNRQFKFVLTLVALYEQRAVYSVEPSQGKQPLGVQKLSVSSPVLCELGVQIYAVLKGQSTWSKMLRAREVKKVAGSSMFGGISEEAKYG